MAKRANKFVLLNDDYVNPDTILNRIRPVSEEELIVADAVEHLQGRQKEVYLLTMRLGLSLSKTASELNIKKATAQVYKARAISFVTAYCKQAIKNNE